MIPHTWDESSLYWQSMGITGEGRNWELGRVGTEGSLDLARATFHIIQTEQK